MCLADLAMTANSVAEVPVIESHKNYCGRCSPFGFPYGEPGTLCSRCGGPIQPKAEHVAMTRVMRNRHAVARQRESAL